MNKENVALLLGSVVGATLALTLLQSWQAHAGADGDPATDDLVRVIPYQGRLELNGVKVDGTADMRFRLYDRGASAASYEWQATKTVEVTGGRFDVLLGESSSLDDDILDAEELYLGIEVKRDGSWVALGKQPLAPTAFALWTPASTNLRVGGVTWVSRDAKLHDAVASTGDFALQGQDATLILGGTSGRHDISFGDDDGNEARLRYGTSSNQVVFQKVDGGNTAFSMDYDTGNVGITGAATVGSELSAGGIKTLEGRDVIMPGTARLNIGKNNGSSSRGLAWGSDVSGEGFQLIQRADLGVAYLETGDSLGDGPDAMRFHVNGSGAPTTDVVANFKVQGKLVLPYWEVDQSSESTTPFQTIESDDIEISYINDNDCVIGSLTARVINNQSAICACRASGAWKDKGHGWICLE